MDQIENRPPISLLNSNIFSIPYFSASILFDVIAIKLLMSLDQLIAVFKLAMVSSVVKDLEEIKKQVSSGFKLYVLYLNSSGSEPVINSIL